MRSINTSRHGLRRVASALAATALTGVLGGAQAATWCVPGAISGVTCEQTRSHIGVAVQDAAPGDTIHVAPGNYDELVPIWKRLTLLGAQAGVDARGRTGMPESTIVSNGGQFTLRSIADLTSAGSTIDGFTFSGGVFGIQSDPSTNFLLDGLTIRNNRFLGHRNGGIVLSSPGSDITIDQNYVEGPPDHPDMLVSLRHAGPYDGLLLTNNRIVNGGVAGDGFRVTDPAALIGPSTARAPLIRGNAFSGNRAGAFVGMFAGGEISDNAFEMNLGTGLQGGFAETLIARNLFIGNAGPGMFLNSSPAPGTTTTNTITGNAFVDNQFGVWYDGNETIAVAGNYWGAESGPYHPVRNPGGVGDTVMDQQAIPPGTGPGRLEFVPWLDTSPIPLPSARTWCVPMLADGCDLSRLTIRSAVDAAWPGDIVKVAAGTYDEGAVRITKQLTLRGAQAGIDARNRVGSESIVTTPDRMAPIIVLAPGSAGSIIDGFTLKGGDLGIQTDAQALASIGGLQILNNRIIEMWASGIFVGYPGNDITIDRNFIDGSDVTTQGMLVGATGPGPYLGFWLTNNQIVNGRNLSDGFRVMRPTALVGLSDTRSPMIKGNTISANNAGVVINSSFEDGEIRDNVVSFNIGSGIAGRLVRSFMIGNTVANNGGPGWTGSAAYTNIADNDFLDNMGDGVNLMGLGGGSDNVITDNVFARNALNGLMAPMVRTSVAFNTFDGNGKSGVSWPLNQAASLNTFRFNDFLNNGATGVEWPMSDSTVSDNRFIGNTGGAQGVLQVGAGMVVERNLFEGNRSFALFLRSGVTGARVTGNTIAANGNFISCSLAPPAIPSPPDGCGGGILFGALRATQTSNAIYENTISGNRVGAVYVGSNASTIKDLTHNDWGSASGPYHATRNPAGTANAVIDQSSTTPSSGPGMILFDPWIGIGYTPAGTNVDIDVTAALPGGSTAWVGVGFDEVLSAGHTSVATSNQGPAPPAGFQLGKPPVYYDVATTATFSGNVEVCFTWTEGQFHNEKTIRLQHYEASAWVDVTTSLDTAENVACGRVTSFSPFALMEVAYAFTGFFPPIANPPALNTVKAGQSIPVKFSVGGYRGLDLFDPGYPKAGVIDCANPVNPPPTALESTVLAGSSALEYEPTTDAYIYVWKTMPGWVKTCRALVVNFLDGSQRTAYFQFRR